jgi:hypothetical protein
MPYYLNTAVTHRSQHTQLSTVMHKKHWTPSTMWMDNKREWKWRAWSVFPVRWAPAHCVDVERRQSDSFTLTGGWKILHNEELHNLYSSPTIIRMIKSRRLIWAGHVARMGEREVHIGYWWECQKERDHLGRPRRRGVDNIKMDFRQDGMVWTDSTWLRVGTSRGLLWTR